MSKRMSQAWLQAAKLLEKVLPEDDFDTWITPVHFSHHENSIVYLSVPDEYVRWCMENHYVKTLMAAALSKTSGHTVTVNYIIRDADEWPATRAICKPEFSTLNPKYTFDNFVQGSNNQAACNAAMSVANNLAATYSPLHICAGPGLGKSHLLNAIGHVAHSNMPDISICYCSIERFMCEMVNHLRQKKMDLFRKYMQTVDVLMIDDIQFLSGKTGMQEEFFYIFNELYEAHKQIVITSDILTQKCQDLDERLRSRFEWGLVVDIQPPDKETKFGILRQVSEVRKIQVPDEVLQFIAASNTNDIRILEEIIARLGACSNLQGHPITLDMARENLKDRYELEASNEQFKQQSP
ncbi:MAG: chromosomal replication initiator protein DnaA [Desulfuromonadales bacterium]